MSTSCNEDQGINEKTMSSKGISNIQKAAEITKRSFRIGVDIPYITIEYSRSWMGGDSKNFCPPCPNPTCSYTMTVVFASFQPADEDDDDKIDVWVPNDAELAVFTPEDYHITPVQGDIFELPEFTIQSSNDPFYLSGSMPIYDMFIPEQNAVYYPEVSGFVIYYYPETTAGQ
jgi:hypothetical protein